VDTTPGNENPLPMERLLSKSSTEFSPTDRQSTITPVSNMSSMHSRQSLESQKLAKGTPSPIEGSCHRSTPSPQLEEFSVVVIKDLDDNGHTAISDSSVDDAGNGLRICNSESNVSLREQTKSPRSRSADGKLSSSSENQSLASKSQSSKPAAKDNYDAPRKSFHNLVSSILYESGISTLPGNSINANSGCMESGDNENDTTVALKREPEANNARDPRQSMSNESQPTAVLSELGQEDSKPSSELGKESKQTAVSSETDQMDFISRVTDQGLGNEIRSLNGDVAKSQSFDSRDRYATDQDSRKVTRISAVVQKSERAISILESSEINADANFPMYHVSSSVSHGSRSSRKSRAKSLSMIDNQYGDGEKEAEAAKVECGKKSPSSNTASDKPFWGRLLRQPHAPTSDETHQTQAEKRASRKNKVRMDLWNMIRGNKLTRNKGVKQKPKASLDQLTEVTDIPATGPSYQSTLPNVTIGEQNAAEKQELTDEDRHDNFLLESGAGMNRPNNSPSPNTLSRLLALANPNGVDQISSSHPDPRDDQSAEDDFGIVITITHDSDCEEIETAFSESLDPNYGVEVEKNESYLRPKDSKYISVHDDNSFPSIVYPYLDPKRVGSKGRERQHSKFFRNRPAYLLEKSLSGLKSVSPESRISNKYGVDKFSFLEPPEVPSKSMFDSANSDVE
jgi:hypothetical protein